MRRAARAAAQGWAYVIVTQLPPEGEGVVSRISPNWAKWERTREREVEGKPKRWRA